MVKKYIKFLAIVAVLGVISLFVYNILFDLWKDTIAHEKVVNKTKTSSKTDNFYNIEVPESFDWKKYSGTTLNFIVENNINADILTKHAASFTDLTGININIVALDFDSMIQKINLDFISKTGKFTLIYVDPYQTLNRFSNDLCNLNKYNNSSLLPNIQGGLDDFFEEQVMIESYFINQNRLCSIPFDTTTMIFFYRKDIFNKYRDQFMKENGFDWTPGTPEFTWERFVQVSEWISNNVPKSEVKYGSGYMGQKHNSLYCLFSTILASYGGDYFEDENISTIGTHKPNNIVINSKAFIEALKTYKKINSVSSPESRDWNWYDTAEAFKNGEVAMMLNWDENISAIENAAISKVAGNVGYSILPYGSARSANIYGGSGIGINNYATDVEKEAAWLFIVWATSPQVQSLILEESGGGSLPPRKSISSEENIGIPNVYTSSKGISKTAIKQSHVVLEAWKKENVYYRPKVENFYHIERIIIDEVYNMMRYDLEPELTAQKIYTRINNLT
ncbi:ABC transporter substrate-binding protein [Cellulosilyticum sp. I15G10I2]|uniref:ABC transporter substrate-binding protein n=1 Tax=Cellulosilyticum sp. I15G10I2 TaxID=1892843 RepID=UPI00085C4ECE|nr:extracellular solute-binding protein [Cellulosilyticum sp. I15G10I2]